MIRPWNPSCWVDKSTDIFNYEWPHFVGCGSPGSSSKDTLLPPGNYEWPFELMIDGSTSESIEGLSSSNIIYKLEATVSRGKLGSDLHAQKPVRIIRTQDPAALELARPVTVESIWPNKIEYHICIPQRSVVFGTEIVMKMRFTRLLKGLKIGMMRGVLVESQEFNLLDGTAESILQRERVVDSWEFEPNNENDMLDGDGQDGYNLERELPLPKRLSKCVQDVDTCGIKITHRVQLSLDLHNPDGNISEVSPLNTTANKY